MLEARDGGMMEMPKYKCHKEVWALKIERVLMEENGGAILVFGSSTFKDLEVDKDFVDRKRPENGWYYVVYEDGYKSCSPAKAFEDGYTKI